MKDIANTCLLGWREGIIHGWTKPIGLTVVCGALSLALCSSASAASSTPVTQLDALQWLVQASGDSSQFSANSTTEDYVAWANLNGISVQGGINPGASLSTEGLGEMLVRFFGINPKKKGGDFLRILEREGIALGQNEIVTRAVLVGLFDDYGFQCRIALMLQSQMSPVKGNNGVGNGIDPPPPGWQRNHPGRPENDRPGTGPGNPGSSQKPK